MCKYSNSLIVLFEFGLDPGTEYRMFFGTRFAGVESARKNSKFIEFTTKGQAKNRGTTQIVPLQEDPNYVRMLEDGKNNKKMTK